MATGEGTEVAMPSPAPQKSQPVEEERITRIVAAPRILDLY